MAVKTAERQWLVSVSGVPGFFQTKSGGATSVEHTLDHDGGNLVPDIYQGPPRIGDLTVARSFEVPRDQTLAAQLRRILDQGQRFDCTVSCTPTDESLTPIGSTEVYECTLKSVQTPEANSNSQNPSRIELTFTVRRVR